MARRVVELHRIGVDERTVRLAETQAREVVDMLQVGFDAAGLTVEQRMLILRAIHARKALKG